MARPKPSRPTDAELSILNVLWLSAADGEDGMTIRQIANALKESKPTTYATTQTLVRIMEKKGLLHRGEARYPTLYSPAAPADVSKGQLLRDFIDRVFGGSMKQLVMHALSDKKTSRRDLQRIQKIIDQMEE